MPGVAVPKSLNPGNRFQFSSASLILMDVKPGSCVIEECRNPCNNIVALCRSSYYVYARNTLTLSILYYRVRVYLILCQILRANSMRKYYASNEKDLVMYSNFVDTLLSRIAFESI